MHTRRMATFVLGIWIGCSVLVGIVAVENVRSPGTILGAPSEQASQILKKLTPEESRLLLRYQASEQNRRYLYLWEVAEIGLGLTLAGCLFFGTQRRIFPQAMCGLMLLLVAFEHFAITPEMNYRGREADFPPGSGSYGTQLRVLALDEVYIIMEGAKLLIGGILVSYLFVFRSKRRVRKTDLIDQPDHSHADG